MNALRFFIISAVIAISVPLTASAVLYVVCQFYDPTNLCPMNCVQNVSPHSNDSKANLVTGAGSGGGDWFVYLTGSWPGGSVDRLDRATNITFRENNIPLNSGDNTFITECWSDIQEYEYLSVTVQGVEVQAPPEQCGDTLDNDDDGLTDLADPGCDNAADPDEYNAPTTKWVNIVVSVQDTAGNPINGGSWSVSCPDTNKNSECPLSGTGSYASGGGALAGQGDYTLSAGDGNGYTLQSVSPSATQTRSNDASVTETLSWTLTYAPVPTVDILCNSANSCSIQNGASATLSWSTSDASSCTASGAWSGSKPTSGSESTGALTSTRTYTLTCNGVADSVTVTVAANSAPTVSSVRLTEPDYCALGPGGIVSWTFNDSSDTQSAYQVQIDDGVGFTSVNHDSGQVSSSATSYSIPQGDLTFNRTYYARVRTWDAGGLVSSYANMSLCTGPGCAVNQQSWSSPQHQYPSSATFTATPQSPRINQSVTFTSQAVCYNGGGNPQACASWEWTFGDGASAGPGANLGTTTHAYSAEGTYTATMQVADGEGYTCPATPASQNITVETLPLPKWKEVLPR
ncbi:MAG: PKD domain-containing protein [Patescibacteria group bacterium]